MSVFRRPRKPYENATAPVGDLISEVGRGVAEAQQQLDASALDSFRAMYSQDDVQARELRAIGYLPTWYQIPETTAEINLSMSMGVSSRSGRAPLRRMVATPVDAGVQNQFDFKSELSSKIQFRIVPIPPPVDAGSTAVVPELTGLTVTQAMEQLDGLDMEAPELDIDSDKAGDKTVEQQDPEPGTLVGREERVRLFTG